MKLYVNMYVVAVMKVCMSFYEVNSIYGIRAYLTVACGMLDVSPQTE